VEIKTTIMKPKVIGSNTRTLPLLWTVEAATILHRKCKKLRVVIIRWCTVHSLWFPLLSH